MDFGLRQQCKLLGLTQKIINSSNKQLISMGQVSTNLAANNSFNFIRQSDVLIRTNDHKNNNDLYAQYGAGNEAIAGC